MEIALDYGSLPSVEMLNLSIKDRQTLGIQTLGEGLILTDPNKGYQSGYPFRVDLLGKYLVTYFAEDNFNSELLEGWSENYNP